MTRNNVQRAFARLIPAALALSVLAAGPAGAADRKHPAKPEPQAAPADREAVNHARESTACLKLAERAPDAAFDSALTWEDRGGGDMARLCQAMALFHQGQFQAAATRLEDLVPTLGSDTAEGASSLLARAGWAWLRAGNPDRAERAYGAALERTPQDPELLIDRAFARAEARAIPGRGGRPEPGYRTGAEKADPYLYRAGAYRSLGKQTRRWKTSSMRWRWSRPIRKRCCCAETCGRQPATRTALAPTGRWSPKSIPTRQAPAPPPTI